MRYKGDPTRLISKFGGFCRDCHTSIRPGQAIYYWPKDRQTYCEKCGEPRFREFLSMAADEDGGKPYAS